MIFILCGPDPPTSQTDGRTDGRHEIALHYSASRGKKGDVFLSHSVWLQPQNSKVSMPKIGIGRLG